SLDELRHLTRNQLTVATKEPLKNLNDLAGVHDVYENDGEWEFQVDSEKMDETIRYLSEHGIVKLESTPPT
ncbi:ABC transporter ATP-binding protein, partial [Salmonella enterica subsp. enterica serovar Enteritidis]